MSEHIKHGSPHEKHIGYAERSIPKVEQQERKIKEEVTKPEQRPSIEAIQRSIETQAISGKETSISEHEASDSTPHRLTKHLREERYQKTLRHLQNQLSLPEKIFSKILHQPVIDTISNAGAKTVARSSGILGGGIFSLLGTLVLYLISKHFGFVYNFFTFIVLFIAGYICGLVIEFVISLVRNRSR